MRYTRCGVEQDGSTLLDEYLDISLLIGMMFTDRGVVQRKEQRWPS